MIADDDGNFLRRWSRRKAEARKVEDKPAETKPSPDPLPSYAAPAAPSAGTVEAQAPRELPPVESLRGLASDYKEFLRPGVDPKLQQAALKKLFHDPHFNVMDGLDTYIDDYSKPDPIPDEMLKRLKQASRLIFPEEAEAKDREDEAAKTAQARLEAAPAAEDRQPSAADPAPDPKRTDKPA